MFERKCAWCKSKIPEGQSRPTSGPDYCTNGICVSLLNLSEKAQAYVIDLEVRQSRR